MRIISKTFSLVAIYILFAFSADGEVLRDYWPTSEWRISSPEIQGIGPEKLEKLSTYVQDELPMTTSVLLIRHGYIVFEYYAQDDPEKLRTIWWVTKSVLSSLTGIVVRQGFIKSIDEPILSYFPEYTKDRVNQKSKEISIRHLLTMSSGIDQEEQDSLVRPDIFSRSLRNDPGKEFFYNDIGPQLLSMILTKATGLSAADIAKKFLFGPIGISIFNWSMNNIGGVNCSEGGYGLQMTTRDLAKLGFLYLNNGVWDKTQIVPLDWILESTKKQIEVPKSSWYFINGYGYFWWIRSIENHSAFTALGYGGQYIYVIPDLDIVVVITTLDAENESSYLQIIDSFIVPSVMK